MGLNYHNLKKHRRNFRDITGLKVEEFEKNRRKSASRMGESRKTKKNAMEESRSYRPWKICVNLPTFKENGAAVGEKNHYKKR